MLKKTQHNAVSNADYFITRSQTVTAVKWTDSHTFSITYNSHIRVQRTCKLRYTLEYTECMMKLWARQGTCL